MIVAMLGEKGGTGKTTFATNLAGMRAATSRDVLILAADRQGSASYWAEKHEMPPVTSVQKFGTGLVRAVSDMARRYGDIVIDIAAGDSREIESALRSARRVIIPVQPAGLDVWTLGIIDERVGEAKLVNAELEAFVVINRRRPIRATAMSTRRATPSADVRTSPSRTWWCGSAWRLNVPRRMASPSLSSSRLIRRRWPSSTHCTAWSSERIDYGGQATGEGRAHLDPRQRAGCAPAAL
jgi:cellulose biosynthesis protein BcsQ